MSSSLSYEGTARTLATGAGTLRYHEAGYGPPLVLLHGLVPGVTGWLDFRDTLPAFAEFFRCLILELPGFGVSDDFGADPMLAVQEALVHFVDALGLKSLAIIGNSMGGSIAVDYALHHPGKVHRLVTVGGIGREISGNTTRDQVVQTPTLLTWGRDDRATPLDTALATIRGFANAELHVFPNCGHWAMMEQREAFENVVLSFLLHRDTSEYPSCAADFRPGSGIGSPIATALGGGCTVRPTVQYVMHQ